MTSTKPNRQKRISEQFLCLFASLLLCKTILTLTNNAQLTTIIVRNTVRLVDHINPDETWGYFIDFDEE